MRKHDRRLKPNKPTECVQATGDAERNTLKMNCHVMCLSDVKSWSNEGRTKTAKISAINRTAINNQSISGICHWRQWTSWPLWWGPWHRLGLCDSASAVHCSSLSLVTDALI